MTISYREDIMHVFRTGGDAQLSYFRTGITFPNPRGHLYSPFSTRSSRMEIIVTDKDSQRYTVNPVDRIIALSTPHSGEGLSLPSSTVVYQKSSPLPLHGKKSGKLHKPIEGFIPDHYCLYTSTNVLLELKRVYDDSPHQRLLEEQVLSHSPKTVILQNGHLGRIYLEVDSILKQLQPVSDLIDEKIRALPDLSFAQGTNTPEERFSQSLREVYVKADAHPHRIWIDVDWNTLSELVRGNPEKETYLAEAKRNLARINGLATFKHLTFKELEMYYGGMVVLLSALTVNLERL